MLEAYTLMARKTKEQLEKAIATLLELLNVERDYLPALVCLSQARADPLPPPLTPPAPPPRLRRPRPRPPLTPFLPSHPLPSLSPRLRRPRPRSRLRLRRPRLRRPCARASLASPSW